MSKVKNKNNLIQFVIVKLFLNHNFIIFFYYSLNFFFRFQLLSTSYHHHHQSLHLSLFSADFALLCLPLQYQSTSSQGAPWGISTFGFQSNLIAAPIATIWHLKSPLIISIFNSSGSLDRTTYATDLYTNL